MILLTCLCIPIAAGLSNLSCRARWLLLLLLLLFSLGTIAA